MTTRIIIRGAAEIEIILAEGVEPPTVRVAAEKAPARHDAAGDSAANPSCEAAASVAAPAVASHDTPPPASERRPR